MTSVQGGTFYVRNIKESKSDVHPHVVTIIVKPDNLY